MTIPNLAKRESAERYAAMFTSMTDEELVDKAFYLGREVNYKGYLLAREREELRGVKAQLLSRLRTRNKPR